MPDEIFCQTELNYVNAHGIEPKDVTIFNGRMSTNPEGWERRGFELMTHHSNVLNWDDDDEVANLYYGEMTSLAKTLSGCPHEIGRAHV